MILHELSTYKTSSLLLSEVHAGSLQFGLHENVFAAH